MVDLLAMAGVKGCYDWLHLLAATRLNTTALHHIATHHITPDPSDLVLVVDSTVTIAAALLPLITRKRVFIRLQRKESYIRELWQATTGHTLEMLYLYHHYTEPNLPPASDTVLQTLHR